MITKGMKVKTDYTGCEYVTAGKEYEVVDVNVCGGRNLVYISADNGSMIIVYIGDDTCPHLDNKGFWQVVKDGNNES